MPESDPTHFFWDEGDVAILDPDASPPEPVIPYAVTYPSPDGQKHLAGQHDQRLHGSGHGHPVPGALTSFDSAEIVSLRREPEMQPGASTHLNNTSERHALRNQITDKLDRQNGINNPEPGDRYTVLRQKQATIFIGPPAAGKSSIADPIRRRNKAFLIDADEAKAALPEFKGGRHAARVHEESAIIAKQGPNSLFGRAASRGDNLAIPIVGGTASSVHDLGAALHARGYKVNLVLVDLPIKKAAGRAVERFHATGRFVDPALVLSYDSKPRASYAALKGAPWVNGAAAFSTDVPRGTKPKRLRL